MHGGKNRSNGMNLRDMVAVAYDFEWKFPAVTDHSTAITTGHSSELVCSCFHHGRL